MAIEEEDPMKALEVEKVTFPALMLRTGGMEFDLSRFMEAERVR